MKVYKKIMDVLAAAEKLILAASTLLILVLTVGNVFSSNTPLLVIYGRAGGGSFCIDHTYGSRSGLPGRRAGKPYAGNGQAAREDKETRCRSCDCALSDIYCNIV